MKIYLVGGAVRDELLGFSIKERDWLVVGSTPKQMISLGYQKVGKDFPVFLHPITKEEYALARYDKKKGNGYYGFDCIISPFISVENDLYRRDLTINAIAKDSFGFLIDPFNGIQDIKNKVIRHVSSSFTEDPLRVLRVARFFAKFYFLGFKIAKSTIFLMKKMQKDLLFISPERIWSETIKALQTNSPDKYFFVLKKCGALEILFPEIFELFKISEFNKLNFSSLGKYMLYAINSSVSYSNNILVKLNIIFRFFFKININNLRSNYYFFNINSTNIVEIFCRRFKLSNKFLKFLKIFNFYHDLFYIRKVINFKEIINFFDAIDVWRIPHRLNQFLSIGKLCVLSYNQFDYRIFKIIKCIKESYKIVSSVKAKKFVKIGIVGKNIKKLLFKFRYKRLLDFML